MLMALVIFSLFHLLVTFISFAYIDHPAQRNGKFLPVWRCTPPDLHTYIRMITLPSAGGCRTTCLLLPFQSNRNDCPSCLAAKCHLYTSLCTARGLHTIAQLINSNLFD